MASRGVNKVILIGHLGRDPELRQLKNGHPVCNLSVATSRMRRDQETDSQVEETEWHRVVLFRKLAEIAEQYLRKGSQVYIEGRLQTRKWQDREGNERWSTEVIGSEMTMLGSSSGGGGGRQGREPSSEPARRDDSSWSPPASKDAGFDDDVPF